MSKNKETTQQELFIEDSAQAQDVSANKDESTNNDPVEFKTVGDEDIDRKSNAKDITEDDVYNAIHELESLKLKVTTRNIYDRLGRGSFSTILRHKKSFYLKLKEETFAPGKLNLMTDTSNFLMKQLSDMIAKLYHQKLDEISSSSNKTLNGILDSNAEEKKMFEEQIVQLRTEIADKDMEITNLKMQLNAEVQKGKALDEENKNLQIKLEHLSETQLLIEKVKEEAQAKEAKTA